MSSNPITAASEYNGMVIAAFKDARNIPTRIEVDYQ
jgi:hypothetical protein